MTNNFNLNENELNIFNEEPTFIPKGEFKMNTFKIEEVKPLTERIQLVKKTLKVATAVSVAIAINLSITTSGAVAQGNENNNYEVDRNLFNLNSKAKYEEHSVLDMNYFMMKRKKQEKVIKEDGTVEYVTVTSTLA